MKFKKVEKQGKKFADFLSDYGLEWRSVLSKTPELTFEDHYSEKVSTWRDNLFPLIRMKEILFTIFLEKNGSIAVADKSKFLKKTGLEEELGECPDWLLETFIFKGLYFKTPPKLRAYDSWWTVLDVERSMQKKESFYKQFAKEYRLKKAFDPKKADRYLVDVAFAHNREFIEGMNRNLKMIGFQQTILEQFNQQVEQTAADFKIS